MANAIFTVMGGLGLLIVGYVLGRSDERKAAHCIAPQAKPVVSQTSQEMNDKVGSGEGVSVKVPEGWKLVPIEPTDEMLDAAQDAVDDTFRLDIVRTYSAMLAAAPQGSDK